MNKLLIIGAGGHGAVVAETARACGFEIIDFLDDNSPKAIGLSADIARFASQYDGVVVSIGNSEKRAELLQRAENLGVPLITLVHPKAYIASSASIGPGSIVLPGAIVHTNARIGKGCIISIGALVDHDARIGDFCHVNTGAIVGAGAELCVGSRLSAGMIKNRN